VQAERVSGDVKADVWAKCGDKTAASCATVDGYCVDSGFGKRGRLECDGEVTDGSGEVIIHCRDPWIPETAVVTLITALPEGPIKASAQDIVY